MIGKAEEWLAEVAERVPLGDHRGLVAYGLATCAKGAGIAAWSDAMEVVSEIDDEITVQEATGALVALSEAGLVQRVGRDHVKLSYAVLERAA